MNSPSIGRYPWKPAALVLAALAIGCGGDPDPASPGDGPAASTIVVDGSSTVFQISKAAQEAYAKVAPGTEIIVDNHGTGGGFGRYLEGEVDIVDASRSAKPEEESKAKSKGLDWVRFLVAHDGITLVVNKKNDFCKSLTVEQLKALWAADSPIKTWKDLNPAWPDRKIVLYSPDNDSGTYEFFVEAILGKGKGPRKDVQTSPDDNVLVKGVAGDLDAVGYFGFAYYKMNEPQVTAVAVQAGEGKEAVAPSMETILSNTYAPLSRPLYIYAKLSSIRKPAVAQFVRYYLDNLDTLVKTAGYVPPTSDELAANRAAFPSEGSAAPGAESKTAPAGKTGE